MFGHEKNKKVIFILLCILLISGSACAKEGDEVFFIGHVGIGIGGDQLVDITYSDGTTESIDAGDGDIINLGFFIKPFNNKNFETQIMAGYNEYKSEASNGTITWSKNNIDLIQFYRFEKARIGAGVTYHFDLKLKGTGAADYINADGDGALGFVTEFDYFFGTREVCEVYIGLKYTNIDYTINGIDFNGNSIAGLFGLYF